MKDKFNIFIVSIFLFPGFWAGGCASHYATPGKAAKMELFSKGEASKNPNDAIADSDIRRIVERQPASPLPARLILVRVQAQDYQSYTIKAQSGEGKYRIITVREIEEDKDYERIRLMPQVASVGTLNALLIKENFNTDKELRLAAAALQPDMLFVYTIETVFTSQDDLTPLSVVTLGLSPTVWVHMTSTASGILMDTRTGFLYGAVEASDKHKQQTSWFTNQNTIDQSRRITERNAFEKLVVEFEKLWPEVVKTRQNDLKSTN
jgi:hypothetical protein